MSGAHTKTKQNFLYRNMRYLQVDVTSTQLHLKRVTLAHSSDVIRLPFFQQNLTLLLTRCETLQRTYLVS